MESTTFKKLHFILSNNPLDVLLGLMQPDSLPALKFGEKLMPPRQEHECWKELGPCTVVCYVYLEDAGFLEKKMLLGTRTAELTSTPLDFSLLGFL